jgi:hypothetical protein
MNWFVEGCLRVLDDLLNCGAAAAHDEHNAVGVRKRDFSETPVPVMEGGASFDANQAGRQLHKKRQNTAALQLLPDNHAVNLENSFAIETDGRDVSVENADPEQRSPDWLVLSS